MADVIGPGGGGIARKYHDNEDGSYSEIVYVGGGATGGGAATVANGADVTQGAIADAAVTTDAAGTISAKLRGVIAILADVWDVAAHRLKVTGGAEKAEDSAHASTDVGQFILAVRNDTLGTALTSTNGDYGPITTDAQGRLGIRGNAQEDAAAASGDVGMFVLGVRRDADGIQTSADGDFGELSLDARNNLRVNTVRRAGTATLTNVANSLTSVTVLAANAARRGFKIFNDDTPVSGASLSVKYGATASATSRTKVIAPGECWEPDDGYTGIIDGFWSAATGAARVTELT